MILVQRGGLKVNDKSPSLNLSRTNRQPSRRKEMHKEANLVGKWSAVGSGQAIPGLKGA